MHNRSMESQENAFKIVHLKSAAKIHTVYLFGKTDSILNEKCSLIKSYTAKVDPNYTPDDVNIEDGRVKPLVIGRHQCELICMPASCLGEWEEVATSVNMAALREEGFNYYVNVLSLLPRPIMAFYGTHRFNSGSNNCHSITEVCAGFFPMRLGNYDLSRYHPQSARILIPREELETGDAIVLPTEHSFVFLDHNISLSMNGVGQPLLLHHTEDVLECYNMPTNTLLSPTNDHKLTIYRKPRNWQYPEEIMSAVLEYAYIARHLLYHQKTFDPAYFRVYELGLVFRNYCDKIHTRGTDEWKTLFNLLMIHAPYDMIETLSKGKEEPVKQPVETDKIYKMISISESWYNRSRGIGLFSHHNIDATPTNISTPQFNKS